ncbi:class I SAM-dependent methyltransferase [Gimesia algae]|uniref:Methyltransferase domain protein n=1 Tax=Gimesia algae TaxID=2527971 RepID=A0A517VMU8_9PLAN|nr:class I SAM-dependent methyltransferase [Gimesia algae]QDT94349.1 hypothetical protein Pan161_60450 [Gimesia algae]
MSYWDERKELNYYQIVKQWLEPFGGTLLDVGCADTPVAQWGEFDRRIAVNDQSFPEMDGVECIQVDWLECDRAADVITCLQVLEHFETRVLIPFVDKIFSSCETAIISVPYMWTTGACPGHVQDPISVRKFIDLVGRCPARLDIVKDSSQERLIALFKKDYA